MGPSVSPSNNPTTIPTLIPTIAPTSQPSISPTMPTNSPSTPSPVLSIIDVSIPTPQPTISDGGVVETTADTAAVTPIDAVNNELNVDNFNFMDGPIFYTIIGCAVGFLLFCCAGLIYWRMKSNQSKALKIKTAFQGYTKTTT